MATALNIMDPDGDLLLKVGGELEDPQEAEVTFRVCSAALRRASPVFKNMLFGPWAESRPGGGGGKGGDSDDPWVVSLPEDKPKPTETVLAIIHGRFELMPDDWNLFTLEEILIVVDKYDMTPCLRPWGKSWTQMVRGKKSDFWDGVPNPNCHPSRVQVAWGLGEEDAFLFTVKNIIFSASLDENDDLGLDSGKSRINLADRDHFGPLNMLDIIKESRLTLIQTILDYYHSEVARLADPLIQVCRPAPQEVQTSFGFVRPFTPQIPGRVCDMAILGSIWTRLLVEDLPGGNLPKKASMVNGSANALLEVLVKMTLGAECTAEHKPCASRFAEFERATRASERWSKGWETEEHKKRLLMQRTKLGATVKETVVAPHPVQNKPQK